MQLFPRVLLANEKTTLVLRDENLKNGEVVSVAVQSMEKYNILYSTWQQKIIIPHFDVNNQLIGVRTVWIFLRTGKKL